MFSKYILKTVPKVLTQVDRDKHSKNYGDCDRNHWHLKTRDFSSAILQQTGLSMALLYQVDFPGNIFYGNGMVKEWAESTVYYWKSIQLRDGSFNEYYPHQHGFPPTAFSFYTMCEVYRRLGMQDTEVLKAFRKTAKYLVENIEERACNQELASITALYSAYMILEEEWILTGLNRKLDRILRLQSEEGWFPEYGGADIGYSSVALDMLAEYYFLSHDDRVLEPLNRIVEFLKYFVHPDGTVGGEYASRNTIYFLPGGLQIMSNLGNASAEAMIRVLYGNTEKALYFMDAVDDRYFSHYILHSFLRAIEKRNQKAAEGDAVKLPFCYDQIKYFEHAGLLSYTQGDRYIIIGGYKGGVCRVFDGGTACFEDYGYRVKIGEGKIAATNWQNENYQIEYSGNTMVITGRMNLVKQKVSTPIMHLGLRVVAAVVGNKIIGMLKNMLIVVNKPTDISFERQITIEEDDIRIKDRISCPKQINLECADGFSLRLVASGKFFTPTDMGHHSRTIYPNVADMCIERKYNFTGREIEETVLE